DRAEAALLYLAQTNDVVAAGPGLGRSHALTDLVFALIEKTATPLVLDADGLNAVQHQANRLEGRSAPLILTPHPREVARLLGLDVPAVLAPRREPAGGSPHPNGGG